MKPLSPIIAALALAIIAVPMLIPGATALAPVVDGSEYSTYRAWNDEIVGMSVIDRQYSGINSSILLNSVMVDGFLLLNQPNGPYPSTGASDYGSDFATTADYYVCWLDENFEKQSIHVAESVGVTGGQNCWGGQITKTIYRAGWWNDDIPAYAAYGSWVENCHISLTVRSPITYQFVKVAIWQINAAFSETIYLVAEYSLEGAGNADYTLSNDWNHPSATKPLWDGVNWNGQFNAAPAEYYSDSLAYDLLKNQYLFDLYDEDNLTVRSALYGYCESLKERMLSVHGWQSSLDPVNGTGSLAIGEDHLGQALSGITTVQSGIATMDLGKIKAAITDAIRDYHLAILYTDKGIVLDYEYEPIGSPSDPSYYTPEEWRALFLSLYITPHITELERDGSSSFAAWLFATPNALILTGATVSLAAVAVFWRSGAAGVAAVLMVILNVIVWKGDLL